jgi:DNA-binding NarL/FixJ family response regulator
MSIRVLLSSKHKVVSEGIAAVLRTHPDIQVVGMAETDEKTQALCNEVAPHVVLIGMHNNQHDLALMHKLHTGRSSLNMVAFSGDSDRHAIIEILDAGAKGFVATTSSIDELIAAVRAAAAGRVYLCQTAAGEMMASVRKSRARGSGSRERWASRREAAQSAVPDTQPLGVFVPFAGRTATTVNGLSWRSTSVGSGGGHQCPRQRLGDFEAIHPRRQNAARITGPFARRVDAQCVGALVVVASRNAQGR